MNIIPMNQKDKNKEIPIIKQIAINNNYNPQIVDDIIKKKNKKQTNKNSKSLYHKSQ